MPRPSGMRQRPRRASTPGSVPVITRPPMSRSPEVGRCRPASTRSSVVFPAPFGPRTASTVAGRHLQVDAVEHLDAVVAGVHRARARAAAGGLRRSVMRATSSPRYAARTRRVGPDLVGSSAGEEAPEVEHVDVVAHPHHQVHVVLDQQDRRARRGQLGEHRREPLGLLIVLARRRLVEEQHLRVEGQAAGQLDDAAGAGGQRVRPRRRPGRPDRAVRSARPSPRSTVALDWRPGRALTATLDVLAHGEAAEQLEALERAAQPPLGPGCDGASPSRSRAVEQHRARCGGAAGR